MKCIIAGSRSITDYKAVVAAIVASGWQDEITEVVCGTAKGVDAHGMTWGIDKGVPVHSFFPDWKHQGKAAGPLRNEAMAAYADALILIWDGQSKGSGDMLRRAKAHGLRVYEHIVQRGGKRGHTLRV